MGESGSGQSLALEESTLSAVSLRATQSALADFMLAVASPDRRDRLFPADPYVHLTNPLSLGFGAAGALWSLSRCGFEVPEGLLNWFTAELDRLQPEEVPPGLMTGLAGIAWASWDLGLEERAVSLMRSAVTHRLSTRGHSYFLGMSGIGVAALHFHCLTGEDYFLDAAYALGDALLERAEGEGGKLCWRDGRNRMPLGYGYGNAGVAAYLWSLSRGDASGEYASAARRALDFDLSHGVALGAGLKEGMTFPAAVGDGTLEAYFESGTAGILRAAAEIGDEECARRLRPDVTRKYSVCGGLFFGLAGLIDCLATAAWKFADPAYLTAARRPLAGLLHLFVVPTPKGLAVVGDGLSRFSCDLATGSAGVLRAIDRYLNASPPDFSAQTPDTRAERT